MRITLKGLKCFPNSHNIHLIIIKKRKYKKAKMNIHLKNGKQFNYVFFNVIWGAFPFLLFFLFFFVKINVTIRRKVKRKKK
jgi:hypothetical protein